MFIISLGVILALIFIKAKVCECVYVVVWFVYMFLIYVQTAGLI